MTGFWIVAGLLATPMFLFGGMKVIRTREQLQSMGMLWIEDYTDPQFRMIGAAEVLGAIGLIVPTATGILPILTPVAATCLGVLMVGAFGVHLRRKDPPASMIITGVLVGLSVYLAWHGFTAG